MERRMRMRKKKKEKREKEKTLLQILLVSFIIVSSQSINNCTEEKCLKSLCALLAHMYTMYFGVISRNKLFGTNAQWICLKHSDLQHLLKICIIRITFDGKKIPGHSEC